MAFLEIPDSTGRKGKSNSKKDVKTEKGFTLTDIPGVLFHPLPHTDGKGKVGNPLAKGLLERFQDGTLSTDHDGGVFGSKVLHYSKMMSYWRSSRDRISNQFVIKTDDKEDNFAILPQILTAGTLTRRAVEKTWLTASNSRIDRIGSELKAMVMSPDNHTFVGADVDSQELWIAAVLGDAYFAKEHGCTALGWMTLQGNKAEGTDMHSVTANNVGVSRDEAKILNYARIYGAGVKFASTLLMNFRPDWKESIALSLAAKMMRDTKGEKVHRLNDLGKLCHKILSGLDDKSYTTTVEVETRVLNKCAMVEKVLRDLFEPTYISESKFRLKDGIYMEGYEGDLELQQARKIVKDTLNGRKYVDKINNGENIYEKRKNAEKLCEVTEWENGSESYTFNHLEKLALSWRAKTPVLGCAISEALTSEVVGTDYLPSRVNWVVQSSAVDYLHLLLSAMKWIQRIRYRCPICYFNTRRSPIFSVY